MKPSVKYFYETSDKDYIDHITTWDNNMERMIFIQEDMSLPWFKEHVKRNLINKDILSIRFPSKSYIENDKFFNKILDGNGICSRSYKWYPSEVWIYSPIDLSEY